MQITDLKTLDLSERQEARSSEAQIAGADDALGAKASDPALTGLLHGEVPEAAGHRDALAEVIAAHGAAPRAHADRTMRAQADHLADARDAALVASAQRVQHDEIALHGSLAARAKPLGIRDRSRLEAILAEQKGADARLTGIAEGGVTTEAA